MGSIPSQARHIHCVMLFILPIKDAPLCPLLYLYIYENIYNSIRKNMNLMCAIASWFMQFINVIISCYTKI